MHIAQTTQLHTPVLRGLVLSALIAAVMHGDRSPAVAQTVTFENSEYEIIPGSPSAELHPSLPGLAVQQTSRFVDLVSRRLRTNTSGAAGVYGATVPPGAPMLLGEDSQGSSLQRISLTDSGEFVIRAQGAAAPSYGSGYGTFGPLPGFAANLGTTWASGFGLDGDVDTDISARGYDYIMTGTAFGIEQYLTPALLAGIVGGFSNAHVDMDGPHAVADIDSYHAGLYGHLTEGLFYVSGVVAFGYQHYDTTRRIPADMETARVNYKGYELTTYVEKGLNLSFSGLRVQPLVGLQYLGLQRDSFREKGAPMNNLTAIKEHVDSLRLSVGGRIAPEVPDGFWGAIVPEFRGRWVHEFLDDNQALGANVAAAPGATFIVNSPKLGRDFGIVGAGVNIQLSAISQLFVDYDFQFSSQLQSHSGTGGLEFLW